MRSRTGGGPIKGRLTVELSEERKQRAATSEVLHLLSGSHGDLNRVFDSILSNATKLCQANFGTLSLYEGDAFRVVAMHNAPPAYGEHRHREPLVRGRPLLRMAETKQFHQAGDATEMRGDAVTRTEFFIWLRRTLAELLERADAIGELLSEGLGLPVYDGGDEITTIDVTTLGRTYLPPPLPRGQA